LIKSPDTALARHDAVPKAALARPFREKFHLKEINFFLGILASGVFLYLALRGVDLSQVWQELRRASPVPLMFAVGVGIVANVLRSARWGVILGNPSPVRLRFLFTSMMIGYLANNLLPARIGELARIYVLERKAGISKSTSAATIVLERLVDTLILLVLIIGTSFFLPLPAFVQSSSRIALAVLSALALGLVLLAFRGKGLAGAAIERVGLVSHGLGRKVQGLVERFIDGLIILRASKRLLLMLALTLIIWGTEALLAGLVIAGLDLNLPWIASLLLVVVLSLSFVIPAAPGGLGTYEFFAITALAPFAIAHSQAVGLAIVLHAVVCVSSTAIGLVCLWTESLSFHELMIKVPKGEKA
jgi:uncharacterized protein (TIRG00374 family)